MIVDWYAQSEKIHKTKRLSIKDPADKKHSLRQEIVYVRYLTKVLGMNEIRCYNEWLKIKNGRASMFRNDPEQLSIEFLIIYRQSRRKIEIPPPLTPVKIYREEVEYLNRLDAPKWVKQFWLAMLIYYKFASQTHDKVELRPEVTSWAMRQVTELKNHAFGTHRDTIGRYNKQLQVLTILNKMDRRYNLYEPAFICEDGELLGEIVDINHIKEIVSRIQDNHAHCSICGKKFVKQLRTQTTLCPACYARKMKEKDRAKKCKNRAKTGKSHKRGKNAKSKKRRKNGGI